MTEKKVYIYPYKKESMKMAFGKANNAYNLSGKDIDLTAKPQEAILHNWVNGKKTMYYESIEIINVIFEIKSFSVIKSYEMDCLKAVVEINGAIFTIDQEQVSMKPLKTEAKTTTIYPR